MLQLSNFEEFEGSFHASGDLIDGRDATQGLSIIANDSHDTVYGSAFSDTINDGYGDDTFIEWVEMIHSFNIWGDNFHGGMGQIL